MKEVFFTEDGSLKINQTIMSQPSFLKIMEDGIVTAEELEEQSLILKKHRLRENGSHTSNMYFIADVFAMTQKSIPLEAE